MAKVISFSKGFRSIVFWSIISAAFIGPGTVTTASKAGASFQIALLWALVFSTFATIILQEAAARITIASGKSLGQIIALKYQNSSSMLSGIVFLSIAFGCAAYQAGNMLGAIEGMKLMTDFSPTILTIGLALFAFVILMLGNFRIIANILGIVVALMGIAFIFVATQTNYNIGEILQSAIIPSFPKDSSLLMIGLVGTTIVPYNLFLASGISQGQKISEMRVGIVIAVTIGGLISIAIMLVGAQLTEPFSFQALAQMMNNKMGIFGGNLFAFGIFAAGLTSSITAPLAAAVTAKSLFGHGKKDWDVKGWNFRIVWGLILLIGLISGLTIEKSIPAIIAAQAINGALLPIITIFLIFAVNDNTLIPKEYLNSNISNIILILLVTVSCFLGINNIFSAAGKTASIFKMLPDLQFKVVLVITSLITTWLIFKVFIQKRNDFTN